MRESGGVRPWTKLLLCSTSFGAVALASLAGCTKTDAELRREDRTVIELIVAEDVRASEAMAEADAAARAGDVAKAIDVLDHRAGPAIEAGLRTAEAAAPRSAWGRARREAFASILGERRAELGPYREAVRSGDAEKLVAAVEAQARIERRAVAAVEGNRAGP